MTTKLGLLAVALSSSLVGAGTVPKCPVYKAEYDYIVVGAGIGGSVMASRLSEDASVSVALVEAGTWYEKVAGNESQVPAYDARYNAKAANATNPDVEWGIVTTPQAGVGNVSVHYARGKSLGGSSNLNYMLYTHSSSGAMQVWADQVGDQSYAYGHTKKYYLKSLNFTTELADERLANSTPSYDPSVVPIGGLLDISYTMDMVGLKNTVAFINGNLFGSSWVVSTINPRNGHRESSATAFLEPFQSRKNLKIYDLTQGERVLFDKNKRAIGVEVTTSGKTYKLKARKEVIVACGAFHSPQLLQVSGVGPAKLLKEHGIPVVADRPGVGENLNDHVYYGVGYRVNVDTFSSFQYGDTVLKAEEQWNTNGTGPLASPGADYVAFGNLPDDIRASFSEDTISTLSKLPNDWPEFMFSTIPAYISDFWTPAPPSPMDGYMYASLLATIQCPTSTGTVKIASSSMSDPPLVNPNWLTTQHDIELVIGGFKRLRQILAAPVLADVTIGPEYFPGASVETDEQIYEHLKKSYNSISHPAASNKMGKASDPLAVVDSHARVYGVKGLRVVDASAFPFLPPGLPQSSVYMLAEKISDDIKHGK
ncbi:putative glucose-methanol-choline oxidoreductase [Rosellinia necatrix]|uniref:Putative glucose-methanol-choline oxidoreductase n=1 Tax=Rosellinia necatrix TaxID=77044 RepID=A0A1S7UMH3_ROSNE|nr:putative glucose-methanol-choline oxidoreductase [Rosellinia necatrix]